MLTEQTTLSTGIAQAARELGTAGAAYTQQQQAMSAMSWPGWSSASIRLPRHSQRSPGPGGFESVTSSEGGVRRVLTNAPDFMSDPDR